MADAISLTNLRLSLNGRGYRNEHLLAMVSAGKDFLIRVRTYHAGSSRYIHRLDDANHTIREEFIFLVSIGEGTVCFYC